MEMFAADMLSDRKRSLGVTIASIILLPTSCLFAQIVKFRRFLYAKRIFTSHVLGCQVIVVGNLTVEGTRKNPVVEKIARELNEQGRKVAIPSRAHQSRSKPKGKIFLRWITHHDREIQTSRKCSQIAPAALK
jgi:tetraacyldisaccharide 4'-kinase